MFAAGVLCFGFIHVRDASRTQTVEDPHCGVAISGSVLFVMLKLRILHVTVTVFKPCASSQEESRTVSRLHRLHLAGCPTFSCSESQRDYEL